MSHLDPIVPLAPDECTISFVSRLACANFARSMRQFCYDLKLSYRGVVNGCIDTLTRIGDLSGIPVAALTRNAIRSDKDERSIRGEKLVRTSLKHSKVHVCPECLRADIAASPLRADQAIYGRMAWRIAAVRTCPVHKLALVEVAQANIATMYDFSLLVRPKLNDLGRLAELAVKRPASGLEQYVFARLDAAPGHPGWLDALELHAAIKVCEVFGAVATFGRKQNLKTLSSDDWYAASGKGFEIAAAGEAGICAFLAEMHGTYMESRVPNEGAHARFGKLYDWVASVGDDPVYAPVRDLVRRCIIETMPLGPGDVLFGEPVRTRHLHSIRTASLETGMHSKPLRRILAATGIIPAGQTGLHDHRMLFGAEAAREVLAKAAGAVSLIEAESYLNAGRVHTKLLLKHGFIRPFLGDAAGQTKWILFARADLDQFLADLLRHATPVDAAADGMADIAKTAKRSNCSAMEIVDLLLKGKLTRVARRAGVAGYAAVIVDVEEVRSHVRGPAADGLTGRQVMVELGTFHAVVRALIDEGHLPTRRAINPLNRTPVKLVDRADLDTFRRTYVPLSELAKKRRVHPRTIRVELEAKGIKPALDKKTHHVIFYRRADVET
jgi:hypothetical protein